MTRNMLMTIVIVIVIVAGGWWYLSRSSVQATPSATVSVPAGWRKYTNNEYGFSILYQKDLEPGTAIAGTQEENYPSIVFYGTEEEGGRITHATIIVYKGQAAISKNRPTKYFRVEQVSLNGMPALKVTRTKGFYAHFYWIEHGDIALSLEGPGPEGVEKRLNVNTLSW